MSRKSTLIPLDISESLGKLPPQAIEMEEAVLGALMLEKYAINNVIEFLRPDHFYVEAHREIYKVIIELFKASDPFEMKSVVHALRKAGKLELIGGTYYIVELTTKVSSSANIEFHARVVLEMAIKRELILVASKINSEAFEDTTDCFECLDEAETRIEEIRFKNTSIGLVTPDKKALNEEYDKPEVSGESCYVKELDKIFKWVPGYQYGWYGWPGDGKGTTYDFMAILKAKNDGDKFGLFKPEDMGTVKRNNKYYPSPENIYKKLVWTYTGKCPFISTAREMKIDRISKDEYIEAMEWVRSHFFVIEPEENTFNSVLKHFKILDDREGIRHFLIDPATAIFDPTRKDISLRQALYDGMQFAQKRNATLSYINHPIRLKESEARVKKNGPFRVVDPYMINGGSAWDNAMDIELSIYKPERHIINTSDTRAQIWNFKFRAGEIFGGDKGVVGDDEACVVRLHKESRRYLFNGLDVLSGEIVGTRRFGVQMDFRNGPAQNLDDLPF